MNFRNRRKIVTQHHNFEPDHDRLVRIETALQHLADNLATHTEELREHIRDETLDFTDIREKLVIHLNESESMQRTLVSVVNDVANLKTERTRLIAWAAGAVFVILIAWAIFEKWITWAKP
jgi:hypothetical protein